MIILEEQDLGLYKIINSKIKNQFFFHSDDLWSDCCNSLSASSGLPNEVTPFCTACSDSTLTTIVEVGMLDPVDEFLEWCLLESSDSSKNLPEKWKKMFYFKNS